MTYSIVAADTASQQVGGAGTSCLKGQDVYIIYGGVPGHGVIHAQANANQNARREGARLLAQGQTPDEVVTAITAPSFDRSSELRQYGVVDVLGNAAGFTGSGTMDYAADIQGHVATFAYSMQGNILTSARVLEQAKSAFEASGCDLAERLLSALEAGAEHGEGDSRCTPSGIPSDSAFLQVEAASGAPGDYLALRVESSGALSPLPELRQKLTAWRSEHPCPTSDAPAGMMSAGSDATPQADEPGGCSCHLSGREGPSGWLLLGFLLVVARWRKRSARQLRPIQAA